MSKLNIDPRTKVPNQANNVSNKILARRETVQSKLMKIHSYFLLFNSPTYAACEYHEYALHVLRCIMCNAISFSSR